MLASALEYKKLKVYFNNFFLSVSAALDNFGSIENTCNIVPSIVTIDAICTIIALLFTNIVAK